MGRAASTSLRLVVSIMLLSAVALAHASGNKVDKNTNREHPSRFSKLAFWRRHKGHDKTDGNVAAKVHPNKNQEHHSQISNLAFWRHHKDGDKSVKTVQANHASVKNAQPMTAHTKPAPRTLAAGKKGQKQEQSGGRAPTKTTATATKPKRPQAAEGRTTASLKQ